MPIRELLSNDDRPTLIETAACPVSFCKSNLQAQSSENEFHERCNGVTAIERTRVGQGKAASRSPAHSGSAAGRFGGSEFDREIPVETRCGILHLNALRGESFPGRNRKHKPAYAREALSRRAYSGHKSAGFAISAPGVILKMPAWMVITSRPYRQTSSRIKTPIMTDVL